ncbi:MAG: SMR family transporter [Pseudomonadota bacterium]|nr:SMR family transporter [Pseudomonadota bacterium]
MKPWMLLAIAIVAEVIGTSALKASAGFTRLGPSVIVVCSYTLAFYLLALTLRHIPVGVAYALWSGVGTALIALAGWTLFGQRLDAAAVAGIALIVAGVLVMNLFSSSTAH